MVTMDRVDLKTSLEKSKIIFGKILREGPKELIVDVKYPEDVAGIVAYHPDQIDSVTHGVYVPAQYRTSKKKASKAKRKTKGCGCK